MKKTLLIFVIAVVVFAAPITGSSASGMSENAFESQTTRSANASRQRPGVVRRSYRSGRRVGRKAGRKTTRGTGRAVRTTRRGTVKTYRKTKRAVY